MKILVIGESCEDEFIYGYSKRLAPEYPVPVFVPESRVSNKGMAGNVAENIKSLLPEVEVVLFTNSNKIIKCRYVDSRTNHLHLRVDVGDNETERIKMPPKEVLESFHAIVISDYCKGLLHPEDIFTICSMNPNVFIDTKKIIDDNFILARYIKVNNHEYELSEKSIKEIPGLNDKIIVTLGSQGCRLMNKIYQVDKVEVKDQVGAGDTFLAGLVCKFILTNDIDQSIIFANECATKVVSKRGVVIV